MRYKDKCDICGKFDFCKGKDNKVLCQKCFNNQEQKIDMDINKQSMNYKCYAMFCGDYKAKNIFEKIYYILWKSLGVSPSGLECYLDEKIDNVIYLKNTLKNSKKYQ